MNKITVNFITCEPAPSRGYRILWRVAGSGGVYIDAGLFFKSPAIFYDHSNPAGTQYEGYIKSDCRTSFGNPIFWTTETGSAESGAGGPRTLTFSAVLHAGGFSYVSGTLSGPVDININLAQMFADGFSTVDCSGPAISSVQADNRIILAGMLANGGSSSPTGDWTLANSFRVYNISIDIGSGTFAVFNGDVIMMGSFSVTIIFDGC